MNILLCVLLLAFHVYSSVTDIQDMRKYKMARITEKIRTQFYKECIIYGWMPVLIIAVFIALTPLSLCNIGIRKITMSDVWWLNGVLFAIISVIVVALLYQTVMYFKSEEYRRQLVEELNNGEKNHYDYMMDVLIPRTIKEKKYFFFVSLTAGICEEIVWRGCMIFLLKDIFPTMHVAIVGLAASGLFGLFHCYQGIQGVIKTGLGGILFVWLYLMTDSLILGIGLHFMFDFSSAFLLREEQNKDRKEIHTWNGECFWWKRFAEK